MMRIITGSARGKKLTTLEGEATRPTSERIKGAIFSSIQFEIENRRVLDLFAGCGQMGLEALSRGAASATFIDSSREAMEIVKANAKATSLDGACKYLVSDYRNYIRKASGRAEFDLVFIDPPYAMECAVDAAAALARAELLLVGALVVLETGTEAVDPSDKRLRGFELIKSASYGKMTSVNIFVYRGKEVSHE